VQGEKLVTLLHLAPRSGIIEAVRRCHYVHAYLYGVFRDVALPFIKSRMIAAFYEAESERGMLSVLLDRQIVQTHDYKMFTFGICLHERERNVLIFESVQCVIIL
jgi:hypothetical protein